MKRLCLVGLVALMSSPRVVTAQPAPAAPPDATPTPAADAPVAPPDAPAPAAGEPGPSATPATEKGAPPEKKADLGATVQFKPGTGAVISTADRRFSLAIRARMQLRYDATVPHQPGQEASHLLQMRRARVQLSGNAFGEHNRFYVQLGFSSLDMVNDLLSDVDSARENPLRDARIELDYLRDLTLWVGQMKVPFSRQRVISSGDMELVDRGITNEDFHLDRDLGIHLLSKDLFGLDRLAYSVGVFMGEGRNAFEATDFGMLWVARLEWLPFGRFDDYTEGDLGRSRRPGLSVGAAYAFHDNARGARSVHGQRPLDGGVTDYHHATADVMFKLRGVSAQLALHYRDGSREPGAAVDEGGNPLPVTPAQNGVGFLAQLGYMLPWVDLQVAGRYAAVRATRPAESSLNGRNEVTVGLGYYFDAQHSYKVQVDYSRLWNDGGGGGSSAFSRGTDRVRAQVQLAL